MAVLVVAEHDGKQLKPGVRNTIAAAAKLGDVTVLVVGKDCRGAAEAVAKVEGVKKVLLCDAPQYEGSAAENIAALVVNMAKQYSHIVAPASASGKNIAPRIAALLDVQQVSDISAVQSADTFVRPTYAGNVMTTVQSSDSIKVITVRGTAFDPAGDQGSAAPIEALEPGPDLGLTQFKGAEIQSRSGRS